MLTDKELDEAAKQLADYRRNDSLHVILDKHQALIEYCRRLKSDYEEEREARERYKQMARGQERNPFVLVLVDADGYVFNDSLVAAGADGGSQAAQLLNDRIKASLRRKGLEHCETMVRLYANVVGLSKALNKAGLVGAEKRSLAPFIANFNRSYPLTDFVDAGELKENADFKLRGLLRLYAENAQCKHIFFAACHDAGYVSELTPYRNHSDRFTLIKTPGLYFHDEFTKLGLGIEELLGVFRPSGSSLDAVYPKPPQPASHSKSTPPTAPSSPAAAVGKALLPGNSEICHFYRIGKCRYGSACKNLHLNPQTMTLPVRTNSRLSRDWRSENEPSVYDGMGGSAATSRDGLHRTYLQQVDLLKQLPSKNDIPDGHVPVNKNEQRLDAYMAPPSAEAESRLRARSAGGRLCNAKQLTGSCNNPACEYDHGPLEEDLIPALEWLSRSLPCPKRSNCRNAACTSGHVCQRPDCKQYGTGKAYCKIGYPLHSIDLAVDHYVPATAGRKAGGNDDQDRSPSVTPSPITEDEEDDDGGANGSGGSLYTN